MTRVSLETEREDTHKKNWRQKAPPQKKKENLALALQEEKREENAGRARAGEEREDFKEKERVGALAHAETRLPLSLCLSVEALVLSPFCIFIYT